MRGLDLLGASILFEDPLLLLLVPALPLSLGVARALERSPPRFVRHFELWRRAGAEAGRREKGALLLRRVGAAAAGLAFLASILAAAGLRIVRPGGGRYALVLDVSASTRARGEEGGSRLERLKAEAARWVERRPAADRLAVVASGIEPVWIAAESLDRTATLGALSRAEPEDAAGRPSLSLAEASRQGFVPVLFTDGGADAREAEGWAARFVLDGPCPNAGFTGFELADDGLRPEVLARFAVRDSGGSARTKRAEAVREGGAVGSTEVRLAPGATAEGEVRLPRRRGGILRLRLEPGDGFPLDDEVGADVAEAPAGPVALTPEAARHPALFALGTLLAEEAGLPLVERGESPGQPPCLSIAGDEVLDSARGPGAWLLFGTRLGGVLTGAGPAPEPATAPSLLAGLPLDTLLVAGTFPAPAGARTLAASAKGPLLYEMALDGTRILGSTFSLEDSNLPLLPAFPVLARRAFESLASRPPRPLRRTGAPPPGVPVGAWGGEELRRKAGPLDSGGYANFLDPEESDLSTLLPSGWEGAVPDGPGVATDPARLLLGIALAGIAARFLAASLARALEALSP